MPGAIATIFSQWSLKSKCTENFTCQLSLTELTSTLKYVPNQTPRYVRKTPFLPF